MNDNFFNKYNIVIIDIETSGFYPEKNSLLEIALISIKNIDKKLKIDKKINYHINPNREKKLSFININYIKILPFFKLNLNISEYNMLVNILLYLNKISNKKKNILVGHNNNFNIFFLKKIINKYNLKIDSINNYLFLDTSNLSLIKYKETILIKALKKAKIKLEKDKYHSALYDALKTAELFCKIINYYKNVGRVGIEPTTNGLKVHCSTN